MPKLLSCASLNSEKLWNCCTLRSEQEKKPLFMVLCALLYLFALVCLTKPDWITKQFCYCQDFLFIYYDIRRINGNCIDTANIKQNRKITFLALSKNMRCNFCCLCSTPCKHTHALKCALFLPGAACVGKWIELIVEGEADFWGSIWESCRNVKLWKRDAGRFGNYGQ